MDMEKLMLICVLVPTVYGQLIEVQPDLKVAEYKSFNKSFSWKNCDGNNSNILNFTAVVLSPDPLILSGTGKLNLSILLAFNLSKELGIPNKTVEIDLSIRLKTPLGYTELCEILGQHVCHFNDICYYLEKIEDSCKKLNITCACPFAAKPYTVPNIIIPIDPLPFLLKGTFEVTAFVKQLGKIVGCLDAHLCVTECMY